MRLRTSCSVCHARKKKCLPTVAGKPCVLCTTKRLICDIDPSFPATVQQNGSGPFESAHSSDMSSVFQNPETVTSLLENEALTTELVNIYFDVIHEKQPFLFHRPSFMTSLQAGTIPRYVVSAMASLAARFSINPQLAGFPRNDRGRPFLDTALKGFYSRTDLVCTSALQGACLLGSCSFAEGLHDQDILLAAHATRIAQMMVQRPDLSTNPIEREVNISPIFTVYWVAWTNDLWYSCECQFPRGLFPPAQYPKPLDDLATIRLADHGAQSTTRETSLRALMISLLGIYPMVRNLNYRHDQIRVQEVDFRSLQSQMDELFRCLPHSLQNDLENPAIFKDVDRANEMEIVHPFYHAMNQMIYFQFLSGRQNGTKDFKDEEITDYVARCRQHASALTEMMFIWFKRTPSDMTFFCAPCIGQMLAVATAVHLHTLVFDADEMSILAAKQYLEQNYMMMMRLAEYWPTLNKTVARMQAIHEACRVNDSPLTFDITSWMADFLHKCN